MEHLTLFQTHQDYEAFVSDGKLVKPNISRCINEDEVHYNAETRLIAKYNVSDASEPTLLYSYYFEENNEESWITAALLFDKVEIDGVDASISDLDTAEGKYELSVGKHTVKYTLKDPTSIVSYVFYECTSLTSVIIPNSVTTIQEYAFSECSGLISVTIPNSVTNIEVRVFEKCTSLTSVTIPDSVTSIENYTFKSCSSLNSVTIPNSVTSIGRAAFAYCSSLTSVTIPDSVISIESVAFQDCSSLTSIVSLATTAPTIYSNAFFNVKTNGTLIVPSGSSGYDVWMGTDNYYLGKYGWTKVEQ